jgi:hypothetical protein
MSNPNPSIVALRAAVANALKAPKRLAEVLLGWCPEPDGDTTPAKLAAMARATDKAARKALGAEKAPCPNWGQAIKGAVVLRVGLAPLGASWTDLTAVVGQRFPKPAPPAPVRDRVARLLKGAGYSQSVIDQILGVMSAADAAIAAAKTAAAQRPAAA